MNRRRPYQEFKNVRVLPSGYQVAVTRNKREFSKHFAGHSKESLNAAQKWRDGVLRRLPSKRKKAIPRRVLSGNKLEQAVVGVFYYPDRSFYQVTYRDRKGVAHSRTFSYGDRKGEAKAYGAAVRFRRSITGSGKK